MQEQGLEQAEPPTPRGSRGADEGQFGRQMDCEQDPLDDVGMCDGGDDYLARAAFVTGEEINRMRSSHQIRPRMSARAG